LRLSLFDEVRQACAAVSREAAHVRINRELIESYSASLPLEQIRTPELHPDRHHLNCGDETLAFFVTLDTINFGSGYFPHLTKRPGMSGYFTVAASLNDYFKANGPLTASQLESLDAPRCSMIFGQNPRDETINELMQLFATALNDLGRLLSRFNGSFGEMIASADGSAEALARTLIEMPFFNDVEKYSQLTVPFYKRAQLTAADLAIAFEGKGAGRFDDLNRLTIFADNLVPHVLRIDNVLLYEDELAEKIDGGELITSGSAEEVEIRACAVHAVELMVDCLADRRQKVTAMELDYRLWNRGQEPFYKRIKPRHRTRTVFY
jgi:putative queuosine salvage protein